jgi:hypothetical protein
VDDGQPLMKKQFWNIPDAACRAGYSIRHFRRIIEQDGIPVMRVGRKFFILNADFMKWRSTHVDFEVRDACTEAVILKPA